jgi:glycosyltransferase involved in cell wall biosynthesis
MFRKKAVVSLKAENFVCSLFVPDLSGGGAERVMLSLATELAARGHTVDLVLSAMRGEYLSRVPERVSLVDLKAKSPILSARPLANYLRSRRPAVLLSALSQANVCAVAARKLAGGDTRIVISIHNTLSLEARHGKSLKLKLMPGFMRAFAPMADTIVAVSEGVAEDFRRMVPVPEERMRVIYNPVVSDDLLRRAAEPAGHPWFADGAPPVVLAAGRLTRQKDFPMLIRAFSRVRKERAARLMILGQGEDRMYLEALIADLKLGDDVSLPGFVSNPYALMNKAALFALSSRFEGLPTVLIEAMACGCPVVATDCPSGPREILAGGRYGTLTPAGDEKAFAAALLAALEKPRATPPEQSWCQYTLPVSVAHYVEALGL